MTIRLSVTLAVSLIVLGASYAFADGMLNDSATTRSRGGVGNYLFWSMKDQPVEKNELVTEDELFESEPTAYRSDELDIRQSSAIPGVQTINFSSGSSRITSNESARLDDVADVLKSDPDLKAKLTGYADNSGSAVTNRGLAESRARSVARSLRARGVAEDQISWTARGERNPISDNATAEGRAMNRRVEIEFQ
ncbi:MAG: OmpA family protein [Bdellovibrionales bacterium]|nr:OmpA family protein [Bdellovibrionales bacterium]